MELRNLLLIGLVVLVILVTLSNYFNKKKAVKIEQNIPIQSENKPSENKIEPDLKLKLFYTEWCGWSQRFLPVWEQLENSNLWCKLVKINCETNKELCANVPGYPYIVLEKNGQKIEYNGDRTYDDLVKFISKNK
jgi:protein disulfide-isomerase A1